MIESLDSIEHSRKKADGISFTSFWRDASDIALSKSRKFIPHKFKPGTGSGRKDTKIQESSGLEPQDEDEASQQTRRRKQVYQAQKLHRSRKAEYVKSLEREIAKLREGDAAACTDKDRLAAQNVRMREILADHGIDHSTDQSNLVTPEREPLIWATMSIRRNPDVHEERVYVERRPQEPQSTPSGEVASALSRESEGQPPIKPDEGAAYVALDFILALEHICKDHIYHPSVVPTTVEPPLAEGHSMTMMHDVYCRASPLSSAIQHVHATPTNLPAPAIVPQWHIPFAEVEKLVRLAEALELDDMEITPAQAYKHLLIITGFFTLPEATLKELKVRLGPVVKCYGFGAVMDWGLFLKIVGDVLGYAHEQ